MASDTGEYFQQIRQELQAGGTDADIIAGDVIWPIQFAANGWIADLSEMFTESEREGFLDGPLQSMRYQDGIYGVPWFTDAGLMYYRSDLLENAGISEPPQTWEDLKQIASEVSQSEGIENGYVFQGDAYEGGVCNALEYVWTHGGRVQPEGNASEIIIDSPESVAGLAKYRSMIEDGVAPQAVANWKEPESANTFRQGNAVFMRNWPYVYGTLSDPEQSNIDQEQVGVVPIPVSGDNDTVSTLGGWNFYIIESSEKKEAAYEFAKFMTAAEQQKYRALEGAYLPTLQSLYEDQEIQSEVPVVELGRQALQNTRSRPPSPVYSDLSLAMQEQFKASLTDSVSPEEAISTLQQELSNLVQQAQG